MSARIVKRTYPSGDTKFVIQQPHFLLRWWWVDAWINSLSGASCKDYFDTYDEAEKALPHFTGGRAKDVVVKIVP